MANPFLMTDDDVSSTTNDLNSNPFLMQDAEDGNDYAADNPFMAQANNPFAGFGDDEVVTTSTQDYHLTSSDTYTASNTFLNSDNNEMLITSTDVHSNPIDSAMSFFGTTITDMDDADDVAFTKPTGLSIQPSNVLMSNIDDTMGYSSEDELKDRRNPPPRPVPPSQTTQDLILSVADQLDQTSSHLLNRIPVTRTPSPVSMRDLHSPSPTPELGDLLDVSEQLPPDLINQNDGFGDSHISSNTSDNPFMVEDELVKNEPARPPPPRPTPPRPTPPRRPSPPQAEPIMIHSQPPRPAPIQQAQAEPDLFDMFGTGEQQKPQQPPAPKSNQDILNLFSTPKPSTIPASQPDLLCGDILSMDNEQDFSATRIPVMGSQITNVPSVPTTVPTPMATTVPTPVASTVPTPVASTVPTPVASTVPTPVASTVPTPVASTVPTPVATADNNNTTTTTHVAPIPHRPPAPAVPIPPQVTTKPQRPAPPPLPKAPVQQSTTVADQNNATTMGIVTKQVTPQQEKENILDDVDTAEMNLTLSPADSVSVSEHVITTTAHSEHSDDHMDTTGVTPIPSANPFASPESEALDIIQPVIVPAPTPQSFTSDGFGQSDEFDAFAAKFDSVKKEDHTLLDGFGVVANANSTGQGSLKLIWCRVLNNICTFQFQLAWGQNDNLIGGTDASDGFGNEDEGFDSFLAMKAPVQVNIFYHCFLVLWVTRITESISLI